MKCKHTYIVIVGNPVEGYSFIGPFDDFEDADDYTILKGIASHSWVSTVHSPTTPAEDRMFEEDKEGPDERDNGNSNE